MAEFTRYVIVSKRSGWVDPGIFYVTSNRTGAGWSSYIELAWFFDSEDDAWMNLPNRYNDERILEVKISIPGLG